MRLAIRSDSPNVARNLQSLAAQWGIEIADDAPMLLRHTAQGLQLVRGMDVTPLPGPIHPRALLAVLQQQPATPSMVTILANGWLFDPVLRSLGREGEVIALTEKESLLFAALWQATPEALSRDVLLKEIWSYDPDIETHTLETHIYRLRQKIEALTPTPCRIETIEGAYRLVL